MRSRLDSAHKSVDIASPRSNSLNKSESVCGGGSGTVGRSDSTITAGAEESPRRLMGLKWNQGGSFNFQLFKFEKKTIKTFIEISSL